MVFLCVVLMLQLSSTTARTDVNFSYKYDGPDIFIRFLWWIFSFFFVFHSTASLYILLVSGKYPTTFFYVVHSVWDIFLLFVKIISSLMSKFSLSIIHCMQFFNATALPHSVCLCLNWQQDALAYKQKIFKHWLSVFIFKRKKTHKKIESF